MKQTVKLCLIAISTLTLLTGFNVGVSATTKEISSPKIQTNPSFKVPVSKNTEQWSVTMGEAIYNHSNLLKAQPGEFEMYSFLFKNNGTTFDNVTIDIYRNEPNSPTKFELLSHSFKMVKGVPNEYQINNLPVPIESTEIEVVISWNDKNTIDKDGETKLEDRKCKQSFVFIRDNK